MPKKGELTILCHVLCRFYDGSGGGGDTIQARRSLVVVVADATYLCQDGL